MKGRMSDFFFFWFLDVNSIGRRVKKRGGGGGFGRDYSVFRKGKGHPFSASNPRGKRNANDKRQFTH